MSKYSEEFKIKVANASLEEGTSLAKTGKKFNVHPTLVRNWRLKYTTENQGNDTSPNVEVDISDLESAIEEFDYEIEEFLQCDGSEFSVEGFTSLMISCSEDNGKISIRHSILTDNGEKEEIDGNWQWVYSGEFDEDYALSGIMDQYSDKYSEILDRFGINVTNVEFIVEPFPEEGH